MSLVSDSLRVPAPRAAGATAASATPPVRVASVPSGHVYVRHLAPEGGGGPLRLVDPDTGRPSPPPGAPWWPPRMLDPQWAATADFDLMHVHFGFDACSPAELRELAEVLRSRRKPLVLTVHDLRNPHHPDPGLHEEQLDVLVGAATALVTLTPGAAGVVARRWGRTASVVPHPHVVPLELLGRAQDCRARRRDGSFRVGLHVKSLRAGMDPAAVLPVLAETVAGLPGAVLQVNAHRELVDPDGRCHDAEVTAVLRDAARRDEVDLRVHDFMTDDELWAYLASLDVSVLPYRFGTHSGWLEACRDLGTTVVAPSCGFFAEQGPVLSYVLDEQTFDADSLAEAVRTAHRERPRLGASRDERRRQRAEIAAAHDRVYAAALATVTG